jgi:hypothetical protein
MSANLDLDIPSEFNGVAALRDSRQFGVRARQFDHGQLAGMKFDRAKQSMDDLGNKFKEFVRAQTESQGIGSFANMVSARVGNTAYHLKQVDSEFKTLRESLPQIAKLTGSPNPPPFATEQTLDSGRTGVNRESWVYLGEAFTARTGALEQVKQQSLNRQTSDPFQQEIGELTQRIANSKAKSAAFENGQLQASSISQDISRLLAPCIESLKTLEGEAPLGNGIPSQLDRLVRHTASPEELRDLLAHMPKSSLGEKGILISDVTKARTSTHLSDSGKVPSLIEGKTPTQSMDRASPRLMDELSNVDHLDAIRKGFASSISDVRRIGGFADRDVDAGGFGRMNDFDLEVPHEHLQRTTVAYRRPQAGEPTRVTARERLRQTEWGEVNATLDQFRKLVKASPRHESPLEIPPLSSAERNTTFSVSEPKAWEAASNERRAAPIWRMSSLLQLRSLNPGVASPLLDYELRRVLELGTRTMEEQAKPNSTRLLALPLPTPRTRM